MKKTDLLYKLTGTETPSFLTERENLMIDKFLDIINGQDKIKKNNTDNVVDTICPLCKSKNYTYYGSDMNQCNDCGKIFSAI